MISTKKVAIAKAQVKNGCEFCKGSVAARCYSCRRWENFIDQMAQAEIPVDYWFRSMKKFYGFPTLKEYILSVVEDIDTTYEDGHTIYIAGARGRGKTMSACAILKGALTKGYSALYTSLSDFVTRVITTDPTLKIEAKSVDFLVIDEIDHRFFPTSNSEKLYGGQLESVLRSRMQNKLPTIMCSNELNIGSVFKDQFKESFESLWSQFVKVVPAAGPDARKNEEKLDG